MHRRLTLADLLAYGLSACFAVAGLLTLAIGDSRIGETRYIRTPVDIVGRERVLFGVALLGAGYVLLRWIFRDAGVQRRWSVDVQLVAAFAIAGYVAYTFGQ